MTKLSCKFRFISPGTLDYREFRKEFEKVLKDQEKLIKSDCEKITRTWKHKPKFEGRSHVGRDSISTSVSTDDKIFGYLDQGTRSHWVRPKRRGGSLAFHSRYKAKSRPRMIGSIQGGGSGPMAFSKGHKVSGIEPREYFQTIKDIRESGFERAMDKAVEEGEKHAWK